jgi:hypothetical protein
MNEGCCRGGGELRSLRCVREGNRRPSTLLSVNLIEEIASDAVLEAAYRWLCDHRKCYWHNNDVWTLRWRWSQVKPQVRTELLSGRYRFEAMDLMLSAALASTFDGGRRGRGGEGAGSNENSHW